MHAPDDAYHHLSRMYFQSRSPQLWQRPVSAARLHLPPLGLHTQSSFSQELGHWFSYSARKRKLNSLAKTRVASTLISRRHCTATAGSPHLDTSPPPALESTHSQHPRPPALPSPGPRSSNSCRLRAPAAALKTARSARGHAAALRGTPASHPPRLAPTPRTRTPHPTRRRRVPARMHPADAPAPAHGRLRLLQGV